MSARVVDADGHVLEPLAVLADWLHTTRDSYGLDHVFVGDQEIVTVPLGKLGTPGSDMDDLARSPEYAEAPARRLRSGRAPARHGPRRHRGRRALPDARPQLLGDHRRRTAAMALARAYNDWLARVLRRQPAAPVWRRDGAIAVIRRRRRRAAPRPRRARIPGGVPPPEPVPRPHDRHPGLEPVWAAAEELGVTIGIHEGSSNTIQTLGADRRPFNPLLLHAMSHAFEQMLACAHLVTERRDGAPSGSALRLPRVGRRLGAVLAVAARRAGPGFGRFCPEMKLMPSEYFARQCWITFESDEPTLPALAPHHRSERVRLGLRLPAPRLHVPGRGRQVARHDRAARRARAGSGAGHERARLLRAVMSETIDSYFAAIRAKDADALGALFTADARLVTLAGTFTGPEAIAGFYRDPRVPGRRSLARTRTTARRRRPDRGRDPAPNERRGLPRRRLLHARRRPHLPARHLQRPARLNAADARHSFVAYPQHSDARECSDGSGRALSAARIAARGELACQGHEAFVAGVGEVSEAIAAEQPGARRRRGRRRPPTCAAARSGCTRMSSCAGAAADRAAPRRSDRRRSRTRPHRNSSCRSSPRRT